MIPNTSTSESQRPCPVVASASTGRHAAAALLAALWFTAGCNETRTTHRDSASATRATAATNGELPGDDDAVPLSSPAFDSLEALAREGAVSVRRYVLRTPSDSASLLLPADTAVDAPPSTHFVLTTDSAGTLRRADYEPVTPSGEWTGTFSFLLDTTGQVQVARLDVTTLATDCASPIRVLEEWVPATRAHRRYVLDQDDHPLADLTCGESVPPLDSTLTDARRLRTRAMLPSNWESLVRPEHDSVSR